MKNFKKYGFSVNYNNWLLKIKKNWITTTTAEIDNDENLNKNINYLLILDYTYEKKYNLMKKLYRWDYEKARMDAKNTDERNKIETEKENLLNNL